jgi:hypothetical protein
MKPQLDKTEFTEQEIADAKAAGLPVVAEKQVVAHVRLRGHGCGGISWYGLEDGTDIVMDDDGQVTQWPEEGE